MGRSEKTGADGGVKNVKEQEAWLIQGCWKKLEKGGLLVMKNNARWPYRRFTNL